ncbi:hypothetical protein [Nocardia farcinica]|uniref:hypothetical protein n=1 Tax=Nocardia farcinica TaxID=37329 RepID=UPI0018957AA2|nr:hypothetical protein [Nocardia farcinica]MBF6233434.1 hypothetical protein [Nocardia farcinica]MBF6250996.1 hypothetical protein [Nocardia farcinica]
MWDIIARLAQEAEQDGRPSPVLDHNAPRALLTLEQAHTVLQMHRACERWQCPRKAAAWNVLVDAGRIVPRPANGSM